MSVMYFRIKMFPFRKKSESFNHPIIQTDSKELTPNVPLNRDDGPFCLQLMNGIQGTKPDGRRNRLLDEVFTILEYKKITIDNSIYIKVFSDGTLSYLTVSTYDVLSTTNNETSFPELTFFLGTL